MLKVMPIAYVIGLWSSTCIAETAGSWVVDQAEDGTPYVATINDSDVLFGKWCEASEDKCFWVIASPTVTCDTGHEYISLVSSDLGTMSAKLVCSTPTKIGTKKYWRYVLSNHDEFDTIAMKSNSLGFAIAMDSGNFRVLRFPMNGSDKAMRAWSQRLAGYLNGGKKPNSRPNTKDAVL